MVEIRLVVRGESSVAREERECRKKRKSCQADPIRTASSSGYKRKEKSKSPKMKAADISDNRGKKGREGEVVTTLS